MPLASPPLCASAGAAANHAVKIAMMTPNRQAMGPQKMHASNSSKPDSRNAVSTADH
jgi:hypothetical protein